MKEKTINERECPSYFHQRLESNYFFHNRILILFGLASLGFLLRNILTFLTASPLAKYYFALYLSATTLCLTTLGLMRFYHRKKKHKTVHNIIVVSSTIIFYFLIILSLLDSLYVEGFDYTAYTFGLLIVGFLLRLDKKLSALIMLSGFLFFLLIYSQFEVMYQSPSYPLLAINALAFYFSNAKENFFHSLYKDKKALEAKSSRDSLTNTYNRAQLKKVLKHNMEQFRNYGTSFSLIFTDIDNFKQINDQYGHTPGDRVLQRFAGILKDESRSTDWVIRYGGEEFLIILPATDMKKASLIAERIRSITEQEAFPELDQQIVTASFGITASRSGDSTDTLFKRADDLLYQAKGSGKNRCCCA